MTITLVDGIASYDLNGFSVNSLLGKTVRLSFHQNCQCVGCGAPTAELKDGHCSVCLVTLAACDQCRVKPETCHFASGTCREPSWGEENCFTDHVVYLSNTSGVKVGITRARNADNFSRWLDQGATQALPVFVAPHRLSSGLLEVAIASFMADKTNWRRMLAGNGDDLDLEAIAADLVPRMAEHLALYGSDIKVVHDAKTIALRYPVLEFPAKVSNPINIHQKPDLEGVLVGMKAQYLMLKIDGKVEVVNMRKYAGYGFSMTDEC